MSLQRRRELARLSKPELIDRLVTLEATHAQVRAVFDASRETVESFAERARQACQESPDTEIATSPEVE